MTWEGITLPWPLTNWVEFQWLFLDKWNFTFCHQAISSDPKFRIQVFLASLKGPIISRYLQSFKSYDFFLSIEHKKLMVLLFKTVFRHWNRFLSSVAKDEKDGHGLKLEKVGITLSSFIAMSAKVVKNVIMVYASWWNLLLNFFFFTLQEHFVYG